MNEKNFECNTISIGVIGPDGKTEYKAVDQESYSCVLSNDDENSESSNTHSFTFALKNMLDGKQNENLIDGQEPRLWLSHKSGHDFVYVETRSGFITNEYKYKAYVTEKMNKDFTEDTPGADDSQNDKRPDSDDVFKVFELNFKTGKIDTKWTRPTDVLIEEVRKLEKGAWDILVENKSLKKEVKDKDIHLELIEVKCVLLAKGLIKYNEVIEVTDNQEYTEYECKSGKWSIHEINKMNIELEVIPGGGV